jgi:tRNA threonylcarbamoyladenosine biosynthesis protein TsaB
MKLLAIDTAEEACSAALLIDGQVLERFEVAPRRHSELILPMMDALLADAGMRLEELDCLAFVRGPGSFTGVRIAASVAQGAAFGADLPVVPVSSLQALAQGARRKNGARNVLSALDARMNEVYWAAWRVDAGGTMRLLGNESVCAPEQAAVPDGDDWTGVGSGWDSYAEILLARCGRTPQVHAGAMIHAQDAASIAATLFVEGAAVPAEQALPVYLRDQVAWAKQA